MQYDEAKYKFIQTWGSLASDWGINRTMAQIHALLLVAPGALCAEEIMEELNISRGNANMNIRALIDWGLAFRDLVPGERKEFFIAEKDVHKMMKQIVKNRRQRELQPVVHLLAQLKDVEGNDKKTKEFAARMKDLHGLTQKADAMAEKMIGADASWIGKTLLKLIG